MSKRNSLILLLSLLIVALFGGIFLIIQKAPPRAARLLPEADAIVFLNLQPLRLATHFDRDPITRSLEFQRFIDATGFVPERDLDSTAFALHQMPDPNGPNGPVAFSELFIGRFDGPRVAKYLSAIANKQEIYAGHVVYEIPIDGRVLRVSQLVQDTVAASNAPTSEQIHAILDRNNSGLSIFTEPKVLEGRYASVPALSPAWAVGRLGLPFAEHGRMTVLGLQLPLAASTEFVASLRYTTSLQLRVEQLTASEADAHESVQALSTLLAIFRVVHSVPPVSQMDEPMLELANSLKIQQNGNRAVLTAELPDALLQRIRGSVQ